MLQGNRFKILYTNTFILPSKQERNILLCNSLRCLFENNRKGRSVVRLNFEWVKITVKSQFTARAIIKTRSSEVGLNSSWAIIRVRAIISTSIFLLTK